MLIVFTIFTDSINNRLKDKQLTATYNFIALNLKESSHIILDLPQVSLILSQALWVKNLQKKRHTLVSGIVVFISETCWSWHTH